ncbi:accessory factor UbiK family protein [Nisaea sediminum]|uniref:accessory factor UbiK family protein n=1 Tax=Nisaea sediminum TaxID=2775867 RepID=UPI0018678EA5|nr:accessory factor UbiK family protein [Nisaea sediminum]
MQTSNRFFDDLAKMASGAMSAAAGVREEFEQMIRQQFERFLGEHDLVTYEEFAAVRDQAAAARKEQEALAKRISALEKEIAALKDGKARTVRRAPKQSKTGASAKAGIQNATKDK